MPPVLLLPRLVENAFALTLDGGNLVGDPLLSANSKALFVPLPFST